jgi:dTDP-glucose pyrophosphorylase
MWGIIPAAGAGSRIQPLAFSKELLPVGSRIENGIEHPRAVSEYLIERMIRGGATKLCFVISPGKSDVMTYYGGQIGAVDVVYVVQPRPAGLCDALFRACSVIPRDEPVLIGLPDTIWFPCDGFALLPDDILSFLLFPVNNPSVFDAVITDQAGRVQEVQVKKAHPDSSWIWGAIKLPGGVFHALHALWSQPDRQDEYLGTLVNAYLACGGNAQGIARGESYVDVGTLNGYREALRLLEAIGHHSNAAGVALPPPSPRLPRHPILASYDTGGSSETVDILNGEADA